MSNDVRDLPKAPDAGDGPLRHFRADRRAVLRSLATGVGAAVFASQVLSASGHAHHAGASVATLAEPAAPGGGTSALLFLDQHAFDTLAVLGEQIVPGARAAQVAEFLDRLLAVESTDTQKRFMQALGAFERTAREAHGGPWKTLTEAEATPLLTKISTLPHEDATRRAFDSIKGAVAETYYSTEAGMKELGWNGNVTFVPPAVCG